jgi:hypothetical protein
VDLIIFVCNQFVCQMNMHLIMWIENAFKFCGKLIHFYKERISFLFYCEDRKRGVVKGGAGNTYMQLHDHPYSYVNIIYSVVQKGERTTDRGTKFSPKH